MTRSGFMMGGKALVLGGGGVTGVAWELGVLAGLAQAGADVTDADVVIGTSAGSVVGAQVTSGTPLNDLYRAQLTGRGAEAPARLPAGTMMRLALLAVSSRDSRAVRARIGRMALAARTPTEAQRRAVIQSRLPLSAWPERRLLITAVDAASGEFVVFDRDSGVTLLDAVSASCAVPGVWPPVTIGERRYIDGGVRSAANADLAAGHEPVIIVAPLTVGLGTSLARQVRFLRRAARVLVISPDRAARTAIGRNVLDPARRGPAATAGFRQAGDAAAAVAAICR